MSYRIMPEGGIDAATSFVYGSGGVECGHYSAGNRDQRPAWTDIVVGEEPFGRPVGWHAGRRLGGEWQEGCAAWCAGTWQGGERRVFGQAVSSRKARSGVDLGERHPRGHQRSVGAGWVAQGPERESDRRHGGGRSD